jgi:Na+(H+)/acetate symporter ActP
LDAHVTAATDPPFGAGVRPPSWAFPASLIAIAASVALAAFIDAFSNPLRINWIGWFLGAVAPMLLLIRYRFRERALRARRDFTTTRYGGSRMRLAAMVGTVVGMWHGWTIASWLAS